ncbi:RnfH family protein [bacterium]|nr:RnfH family protein [bacterium]
MTDTKQAASSSGELIPVEVACALPERQALLRLDVPQGATARDAVTRSKIAEQFPEIDVDAAPLGVFGQGVDADYTLRPGDRVEIYRPLIADPKAARRKRAAKKSGDD